MRDRHWTSDACVTNGISAVTISNLATIVFLNIRFLPFNWDALIRDPSLILDLKTSR